MKPLEGVSRGGIFILQNCSSCYEESGFEEARGEAGWDMGLEIAGGGDGGLCDLRHVLKAYLAVSRSISIRSWMPGREREASLT